MIYEFECSSGHRVSTVYRVEERPNFITCGICGRRAKSVISAPGIARVFPYGKKFENADGGKREFKSYAELDSYLGATKQVVRDAGLTDAQKKVRQEERKHARATGQAASRRKAPKKLVLPEKVDKAFRACPTVTSAVRALQNGRV